jgi:hypothetical protein
MEARRRRVDEDQRQLEGQRVQDAEDLNILKIKLETEIQTLEQQLEEMRATYQLNQEKLDYNYRVLVERDGHGGLLPAKRCLPCPTGTYVAGPAECRACPAENMEASTTGTGCNCLTGYVNYAHTNGFWGRDRTCVESSAYTQVSPYYSSAGALEMFYQDLPVSHPPTDTQPTTRPTTPTRPPMRLAATPCATDGCCPRVRSQSSQGSTLTVTESLVLKQLLLPAGAACLTAITADTTCAPFHEPPHRSQNGAFWPPIARSAPTVRPL